MVASREDPEQAGGKGRFDRVPGRWEQLLETHPDLEGVLLRKRTRLQQALFILLAATVPLLMLAEDALTGEPVLSFHRIEDYVIAGFLPVTLLGFLLGRTPVPRLGAILVIGYTFVGIVLMAENPDVSTLDVNLLSALPLPVLLSSFLLGLWGTGIVFLGGIVAHLGFPVLNPELGYTHGLLFLYLALSLPILLVAYLQRRDLGEVSRLADRLERESRRAHEAEARLRQVTDHIHEVFWLTDPAKEEMLYVSPAYERLTGRPVEELYEDPRQWLKMVHPEDRGKVEEALPLQPHGGYDIRYRIVRDDGAVRWVRDRAFPVPGDGGSTVRLAGVAEDITDRVRLEEEGARAREEAARATELEQVAFVTSHNLQEPLRDIHRFAQLLQRRYCDVVDEEGRELLGYVLDGVQRLQQRIDGLRTYAEVTTWVQSDEVLDPEPVLARVLEDLGVEDTVEELTGGEDLPAVRADPRQFPTLLQAVLENAYKFHPPDAEPRVRVTAEREGDRVRFEVSDDGIGIAPRHHGRVFRIFERLHPQGYPGAGLGLTVAKRIVERQGGGIGIESEEGVGATVWFTLPAAEASSPVGRLGEP